MKLQRNVHLYSDLEYHYWILIETNPSIITFCEQPVRVSMRQGSRLRHTTFDFWERRDSGQERFVEVKYSYEIDPNSKRASARSIHQVTLQQEWCDYYGHAYTVITEKDVYSNPLLLENKKRILSLVRERVDEECVTKIQKRLINQCLTIGGLMDELPHLKPLEAMIIGAHMLFRGMVRADIEDQVYGLSTKLWL